MTLTVEAAGTGDRFLQLGSPGRDTGPADAGASWAKTGGKPSEERKLCTWENTEGGAGSTLSRDLMILDRSIAVLRLSDELLTKVLASSQATSSEATTATTTPSAESTGPSTPRWIREKARLPTTRPVRPQRAATPEHGGQGHRGPLRSGSGPSARSPTPAGPRDRDPTRNPPKERTWTMAPSRRPWMAARATTTTTTGRPVHRRGPRWSAVGNGQGERRSRHHRLNVDGQDRSRASSPLHPGPTWQDLGGTDQPDGLIRTAGIASEMSGVVRE